MIFLYFIPGENPESIRSSEQFRESSLPRTFFDCSEQLSFCGVRTGPDGNPGVILAALPKSREKPFKITFDPDSQDWIDCDNFWLGVSRNSPPTPEGLERKTVVDAYDYSLADGRIWKCPKIRRASVPLVPSSMSRHRGVFEMTPEPEYSEIWEQSGEWSRHTALSAVDAFDACRLCLNLNYRVWDEELSFLQLINQESAADIIAAALDEQFFLDVLRSESKKKILTDAMEDHG